MIVVLILQGCASQPVSLKPDTKPGYLALCLDFASKTENDDKLLYLDAVKSFIDEYNAKNAYDEIRSCSQASQSAKPERQVTLIIQNTRYVPPSKQMLYVLISSAGIYSLLSGGYGFAWAGLSTTTLGVKLSADIATQPKIIYRQFSSWPYFNDLPQVKQKQMKRFQVFMFELFNELKVSK